jgi:putative acyl-CoA dehydrogenase
LTRPLENQPPLLEDYNVFSTDRALQEAVAREAPGCDIAEVVEIGELAGRPATITLGFDANVYPPELQTHDRFGNRIDEVRFHPAWHALMRLATERGLGAATWRDRDPSAHVRRAAKFFIW